MTRVKVVEGNSFTRRSIRLNDEHYGWIRRRYTGTSLDWLINELLKEFIEAHNSSIPSHYSIAGQAVFRNMESFTRSEEIEDQNENNPSE